MNYEYLFFLGLYMAGLITRTGYEILKKRGRVDRGSKVVFACVFAAMSLMWMSWFGMCPLDPLQFPLPEILRRVGLGVLVAGVGLVIGAFFQLRGLENIAHLVTSGLFSKIRHPMYTGFILLILGWAVYHSAAVSLAAGLAGIGNILYWRRLEEEELESRYGEVYREYRKGTWF